MRISDTPPLMDSARLHAGDHRAARSAGRLVWNTTYEPAIGNDDLTDADALSDECYKGNFIDIYV